MVKKYELLTVFSMKDSANLDSYKEEVRKILQDNGFKIVNEQEMGKKILAYPIRKEKEGYYYLMYLNPLENANFKELYVQFKRKTYILRTMMINYDEVKIARLRKKEEEYRNRKIEAQKRRKEREIANSREQQYNEQNSERSERPERSSERVENAE